MFAMTEQAALLTLTQRSRVIPRPVSIHTGGATTSLSQKQERDPCEGG